MERVGRRNDLVEALNGVNLVLALATKEKWGYEKLGLPVGEDFETWLDSQKVD